MLNESFNTTPTPDLQSGVPTVRELLKDARQDFEDAKSKLSQAARNKSLAVATSKNLIGKMCEVCDIATATLDTLTSGGGGAL